MYKIHSFHDKVELSTERKLSFNVKWNIIAAEVHIEYNGDNELLCIKLWNGIEVISFINKEDDKMQKMLIASKTASDVVARFVENIAEKEAAEFSIAVSKLFL